MRIGHTSVWRHTPASMIPSLSKDEKNKSCVSNTPAHENTHLRQWVLALANTSKINHAYQTHQRVKTHLRQWALAWAKSSKTNHAYQTHQRVNKHIPASTSLSLSNDEQNKYCVSNTPACENTPASMSPSLSEDEQNKSCVSDTPVCENTHLRQWVLALAKTRQTNHAYRTHQRVKKHLDQWVLALSKDEQNTSCVSKTQACENTPASMSPSLSSMGTAEGSKASTTSATESTCAAGPLHGTARPVCVCVCVCVNHMHTHIHTPKLHKHNSWAQSQNDNDHVYRLHQDIYSDTPSIHSNTSFLDMDYFPLVCSLHRQPSNHNAPEESICISSRVDFSCWSSTAELLLRNISICVVSMLTTSSAIPAQPTTLNRLVSSWFFKST